MAWFDFAPEGIVEVGIEARCVGEQYGVEAAKVVADSDTELYAQQEIALVAGVLAVSAAG